MTNDDRPDHGTRPDDIDDIDDIDDTDDTTDTAATGEVTPDGVRSPDPVPVVEHGELIAAEGVSDGNEAEPRNSVTEPAKVMRIGSMVKQLLEEVRQAPLDERSRERLAEVYERSVVELSDALSPDLQQELRMLTLPFDAEGVPSESELRVAQAQLVGWLEGLFHGIQATLFAQQLAARQQLDQLRQLPPGAQAPGMTGPLTTDGERPGTYL